MALNRSLSWNLSKGTYSEENNKSELYWVRKWECSLTSQRHRAWWTSHKSPDRLRRFSLACKDTESLQKSRRLSWTIPYLVCWNGPWTEVWLSVSTSRRCYRLWHCFFPTRASVDPKRTRQRYLWIRFGNPLSWLWPVYIELLSSLVTFIDLNALSLKAQQHSTSDQSFKLMKNHSRRCKVISHPLLKHNYPQRNTTQKTIQTTTSPAPSPQSNHASRYPILSHKVHHGKISWCSKAWLQRRMSQGMCCWCASLSSFY